MSGRLGDDAQIEGWDVNRKLVLNELGRVARALESLDMKVGGEMTDMKVEMATLKTRVGLYAALIAAIASVVFSALMSILLSYLTKH